MVTVLTKHSQERIEQRFNNDIHFQTKFKWAMKQVKRWTVIEHNGKRPNTLEAVYDNVKFIYQKIGNKRILITTY